MSVFDEIGAAPTTQPGSSFDAITAGSTFDALNIAPSSTAPVSAPEPPRGILDKVFDIIGRGQYTSAKFFDSLVNDSKSTFFSALGDAAGEALDPQARLSFSDVIAHKFPDFAKEHPIANGVLGFIGDVALDPTTYLTFGYGAERTLGTTGAKLSKLGVQALKEEIGKQLPKFVDLTPEIWTGAKDIAEKVVADAISSGRTELLAKFKFAGVPIAKQGAIESALKTFYEGAGIPKAIEAIKATKSSESGLLKTITAVPRAAIGLAEWLPQAFKAHYALDPANPEKGKQALGFMKEYIANLSKGARRTDDAVRNAFLKTYSATDEEVGKIVGALESARDKTQNFYDDAYKTAYESVKGPMAAGVATPTTADDYAKLTARDRVKQAADGLRKAAYDEFKLSDKQQILANVMHQDFQEIGMRQKEAGVIKDLLENYHPLIFKDILNDKQVLKQYIDFVANPFLPAGEERRFKLFKDARQYAANLGIDIETNGIKLYTIRALEAEKAIAWKNLTSQLEGAGYDLQKLPKRLAEDLRFLGEGDYARGQSEALRTGLQWYDRVLNGFRKFATVLNPAFAVKQAFSNSIQSYMELGPKAFQFFDPRSRLDAFRVLMHLSGHGDPEKFLASKIATTLGEPITGEKLIRELFDNNVIKGTNMGTQGIERTAKAILQGVNSDRWINRKFGPEYEGLAKIFRGFGHYTAWPSTIEDFSRVNLYINARRAGLDPATAAAKVDHALFDYAHGLSQFERRVVRRIVPFYSFQRFVVPLLGGTLLKEPGRIANVAKASRDFMGIYNKLEGGENLNDSERRVLPGWLLDQPFAKFDKDRSAMFRVLSNFNPMDILGQVEVDPGGDVNMEKTLKSAFLAQLAPFIKMPFELAMNRNVFTDRAISGEKSSGRIGKVTAQGVFSNLLGLVGAEIAGLPGAAAGKTVGEVLPEDVAKWVMDATGWEVDKQGNAYMNPYLTWAASSQFPVLQKAIRFDRYKDHPMEKWLDLVGGVPTTRVNIREQANYYRKDKQQEINDLKYKMRQYLRDGRIDSAEQARRDLMELLLQLQQRNASINFGAIRG